MLRKLKMVSIFMLILSVFITGCFKEEKGDMAKGVNLSREKEKVIITPIEDEILGVEYIIEGEILETNIKVLENGTFLVIENKEEETVISVAGNGKRCLGIVIENAEQGIKVRAGKKISQFDKTAITIKKAGEVLLGDFNKDGAIDLIDFNLFKSKFGSNDAAYDIGPATKGSGDWADIYCYASPDGKVGLEDLVVFASNFGKSVIPKPVVENVRIEEKYGVWIDPKAGETRQLTAIVTFTLIDTISNDVDKWESSNTAIATVDSKGLVSFLKEGQVTITATRETKSDSMLINVLGSGIKGIKVNQKNYTHIWAWNQNGVVGDYFEKWPGKTMTDTDADGWKDFTFPDAKSIKLLFNNNGTGNTADLTITEEGEYWYKDNKMYTENPELPYPIVSINPEGGFFTDVASAKISVQFVTGSTAGEVKYTLVENGQTKTGTISGGTGTVEIGKTMNNGETAELTINANATDNASSKVITTTKKVVFTKGEAPKMSRLGAVYSSTGTTFSIWSPDTADVKVIVNGKEYVCTKLPDFEGYTNVYGVTVAGDLHLKEYQFMIKGKSVRDPYGVMVKNESGKKSSYIENKATVTSDVGSNTNIVMDLSKTSLPEGWTARPTLINREDSIIYEVHIGDFTSHVSSGVTADKRGKYMGMVESGTTYNNVKTGIDHLKEMGVTHVQILPFYDFATKHNAVTGEIYNWGYDPVNFNIPEERYAANPDDYVGRIREVKMMINEFHKAGIRVIMDVVYNHTFWDEMFDDITTTYYMHYKDSHELTGQKANASGCGNGIDTQVAMVSRFIRDSLEYWITEYNVDGFRFDLMGIFDVQSVDEWGRYLNGKYPDRNLLMYGEPWDGYWEGGAYNSPYSQAVKNEIMRRAGERVRMGNIGSIAGSRMGVFNGKYREDIKGNNDGDGRGYMFNIGSVDYIEMGIRGGIGNSGGDAWSRTFAADPEQSLNYISAHDNYCLWDKIKHCGENSVYGKRVLKFGVGMVVTSQGIPFVHAGDEMLRTKMIGTNAKEAHNSYMWGTEINNIYWNLKEENIDIFNYHRDLMALRRENAGLRYTTSQEINTYAKTYTSGRAVVMEVDNDKDGTKDLVVVFNAGDNMNAGLPAGTWKKVFDINGAVNKTDTTCEGTAVTVFKRQ